MLVHRDERGFGGHKLHLVARQLMPGDVDLPPDHVVGPEQEVLHGDTLLNAIGSAVHPALAIAGQVHHCLTQRLAGDRARVRAHAAHHRLALGDGGAFVQLRRLDRGPLSGRAGPDHEQVVLVAGHVIRSASLPIQTDAIDRPVLRRRIARGREMFAAQSGALTPPVLI